jgi:hypothetical protein
MEGEKRRIFYKKEKKTTVTYEEIRAENMIK